jgi:hypothetical protein
VSDRSRSGLAKNLGQILFLLKVVLQIKIDFFVFSFVCRDSPASASRLEKGEVGAIGWTYGK